MVLLHTTLPLHPTPTPFHIDERGRQARDQQARPRLPRNLVSQDPRRTHPGPHPLHPYQDDPRRLPTNCTRHWSRQSTKNISPCLFPLDGQGSTRVVCRWCTSVYCTIRELNSATHHIYPGHSPLSYLPASRCPLKNLIFPDPLIRFWASSLFSCHSSNP